PPKHPPGRQPPLRQQRPDQRERQREDGVLELDHLQDDREAAHPLHNPNSFQIPSTLRFTASSMTMSGGQGRWKPSLGHLAVASMPIFAPKFGSGAAWSSWSTGPFVKMISR